MWSLKTSGMEALAGYWALENPVADRLKPRFRVHLDLPYVQAQRMAWPAPGAVSAWGRRRMPKISAAQYTT